MRTQPTRFSITPLRPKIFKKNFFYLPDRKFGMPKKLTPKSQAKLKPPIP